MVRGRKRVGVPSFSSVGVPGEGDDNGVKKDTAGAGALMVDAAAIVTDDGQRLSMSRASCD